MHTVEIDSANTGKGMKRSLFQVMVIVLFTL